MKKHLVVVLTMALLVVPAVAFAEPGPGVDDMNTKILVLANQILNLIGNIGIFLVIGAIMIQGYKIVTASDARNRAEAMHSLVPIFIGAFVSFAAKYLAHIARDFANQFYVP